MIRIEILDSEGTVLATSTNDGEATIGSGSACTTRLLGDDIAETHLRIALVDGQLRLTPLTEEAVSQVGPLSLTGPVDVPAPASITVGGTTLRVSLTSPMAARPASTSSPLEMTVGHRLRAWGLYLGVTAAMVGMTWLTSFEEEPAVTAFGVGLVVAIGLFLWALAWAVGNRLRGHGLQLSRHLEIAAVFLAVGSIASELADYPAQMFQTSASFAFPWLEGFLITVLVLAWHMRVPRTWSWRKSLIVAGLINAAFLPLGWIPWNQSPASMVQAEMRDLGYLPRGFYFGSDPSVIEGDITDLVSELEELEAPRTVTPLTR